jgi:hypothetical protein
VSGDERGLPEVMAEMRRQSARAAAEGLVEGMALARERGDWMRRVAEAKRGRLERLAALEHEQWCYWTGQLISTGRMPDWLVRKWKESHVPYDQLPEASKELDRVWARRVIELIERIEE